MYSELCRFARTCHLGSDGQPTCNCPPGYIGRRCEQCDVGYQGNPLIPGDMCVARQQCDPEGSISSVVDPLTGKCRCKVLNFQFIKITWVSVLLKNRFI